MNQLPLDISLPPSYQEEDFLVAKCNRAAWSALEQWDREQTACALIRGPAASGKTHLAHIWAQRNNAAIMGATALMAESEPQAVFDRRHTKQLVIENIENLASEQSLFHLLNFVKSTPDYRLLLTLDSHGGWERFTLPDLRSRLQALPQAEIHEPDDTLLTALLVKAFQDRQVEISQTSLGYLLPRIERSFDGLFRLIEALDKHAIAKKRPITRSLIQEVLTKLPLSVTSEANDLIGINEK